MDIKLVNLALVLSDFTFCVKAVVHLITLARHEGHGGDEAIALVGNIIIIVVTTMALCNINQ